MLTPAEAMKAAEEVRIELRMLGHKTEGVEITCQECPHNGTCDLAWDLYNTDGDCLAMK